MNLFDVPLFDFVGEIRKDYPFFAHTRAKGNTVEYELLQDHLQKSLDYLYQLNEEKGLDHVLEHMIDRLVPEKLLTESVRRMIQTLFVNMVYCHDLGKTNPEFQRQKMDNTEAERLESNDSTHSMYSAVIYYDYYLNEINKFEDDETFLFLLRFLIIDTMAIAKHHGSIDDMQELLKKFDKKIHELSENHANAKEFSSELRAFLHFPVSQIQVKLDTYLSDNNQSVNNEDLINYSTDWYIYLRWSFGVLTACDFYATSDFMNHKPISSFGTIQDPVGLRKSYENSELLKKIRTKSSRSENDINTLRTELFLDTEEALLKQVNSNLYFLEAPTGSGKTNMSINLAIHLLQNNKELNRLVYVFPFNTLAEQTLRTLSESLGVDQNDAPIGVINSITPIKEFPASHELEDGEWELNKRGRVDYENSLLAREFMHYPIVITSHVKLFECLFGVKRSDCFPLVQIMNSVVILDEIQSYRNKIWTEIIMFLNQYADMLNIKFIIMSATLPHLDKLMYSHADDEITDRIVYLNSNPDYYYKNPLFKNRVTNDYSLMTVQRDLLFETLAKKIIIVSNQQHADTNLDNLILVEFIKKASAQSFYEYFCDYIRCEDVHEEITVELLTGYDNKAERKRIIDETKTIKDLVLICTQVVEAGVDIDMDTGFKNFSIFDAEEQFEGRINRSCKKRDSTVFFFSYDETNDIYKEKDDVRASKNLQLTNPEVQEMLQNKDFNRFYDLVLSKLKELNSELNDNNLSDFYQDDVLLFHNDDIRKHMTLINDNRELVELFLNRKKPIFDDKQKPFYGSEVWKEYKRIISDKSTGYAERKVKLSKIRAQVDNFVYSVPKYIIEKSGLVYNDILGDLYFIENGDDYFVEGKFSPETLSQCDIL